MEKTSDLNRVQVYSRGRLLSVIPQGRLHLMPDSTEERKRILRREKKRRYRARKRGVEPITGPPVPRQVSGRRGAIAAWAKEKRVA
jgi:hypothetical protein